MRSQAGKLTMQIDLRDIDSVRPCQNNPRVNDQAVDAVAASLREFGFRQGLPKAIQVGNGPEFISKDLDLWAYWNKVKLDFSRPGKPTGNALIEAFNARFRQECLNEHWFLTLEDTQRKIEAWRRDCNAERPHSPLGNVPPAEFADWCIPSAVATLQPSACTGAT